MRRFSFWPALRVRTWFSQVAWSPFFQPSVERGLLALAAAGEAAGNRGENRQSQDAFHLSPHRKMRALASPGRLMRSSSACGGGATASNFKTPLR